MGLCFLKHLKLLRQTNAPGFVLWTHFCVWKAESVDLVLLSHVRALETSLNPFTSSKWKTNGPPPLSPGYLAALSSFSSTCPSSHCPLWKIVPFSMKIFIHFTTLIHTTAPRARSRVVPLLSCTAHVNSFPAQRKVLKLFLFYCDLWIINGKVKSDS